MTRKRFEHAGFSWLKLFIILLVISSSVGAVIIGYLAFAHQLPPLIGAASVIIIVGLLIWLVTLLRQSRMRYHTPSFILVFLSLLGITLICAFAGVEPLSTYKDNIIGKVSSSIPQFKSYSPPELPSSQLNGTYVATLHNDLLHWGVKDTASFSQDTVTFYNEMDGKRVFEYSIPSGVDSGKVMILKNVINANDRTLSFQYIRKQDFFILEGEQYYRE